MASSINLGLVWYDVFLALKNFISSASRYDLYLPSASLYQVMVGTHVAVAYAVTLGSDLAFFFVSLRASRFAVPSGIIDIWL